MKKRKFEPSKKLSYFVEDLIRELNSYEDVINFLKFERKKGKNISR